MKRIIALCLTLAACGCEPGTYNIRQTYPAVRMRAIKTLFGAAVSADITNNFKGTADGHWNKQSGEYEFKVTVDSNVSDVLPAYTETGKQFLLPSQQLSNERLAELDQTIITIARDFEQTALPLASQYIAGWRSIGEAKAAKPGAVSQIISGLMAAQSGNFPATAGAIWSVLGPEMQKAIGSLAPLAKPTTQPSP